MFILGLSALEHDPAAALLDGQGVVVAAIEEGKLGALARSAGFLAVRSGFAWITRESVGMTSSESQSRATPVALGCGKHSFARLAPPSPISSAY